MEQKDKAFLEYCSLADQYMELMCQLNDAMREVSSTTHKQRTRTQHRQPFAVSQGKPPLTTCLPVSTVLSPLASFFAGVCVHVAPPHTKHNRGS